MEYGIQKLIQVYSASLVSDFLRYFIAASITYILFWMLLKKTLNHRFIQSHFPKSRRLWFEFRYSMSTVSIFAMVGTIIYFAVKAGYTQLYHKMDLYGWWYFALSIVLAILIHDTYFYWTHRLMHHPKIFKHVHLVHHRSTNPSPWAAYSFHPFEAIVQAGIGPLLIFTLPMHDLVFLIFLTYMIAMNVLGHYGYELFPKGFTKNKLVFWHNTSTHHNLHHKYFNSNYSLYFNWWDRLMHTMHPEYDQKFEEVVNREKQPEVAEKSTPKSKAPTLVPTMVDG